MLLGLIKRAVQAHVALSNGDLTVGIEMTANIIGPMNCVPSHHSRYSVVVLPRLRHNLIFCMTFNLVAAPNCQVDKESRLSNDPQGLSKFRSNI